MSSAVWRKSSHSGAEENCVEVRLDEVVRVRDTKSREGGVLSVPAVAWAALVREISG